MTRVILCQIIIIFCGCDNKTTSEDYYSIEKSRYNISYDRLDDKFNFYKFQKYYQAVRLDSICLEYYHSNFADSEICAFLKSHYIERGYDHSLELLPQIGSINSKNFSDTGIVVLDMNDSITLVNLSPVFNIYALGTCCSHFQNLILRKRNNSICYSIAEDELVHGKLLGIYVKGKGNISGLLIQGYSNNNSDFYGLNSTYNLKYEITDRGIIPVEISNVRNGEPFDKNDSIVNKLEDLGAKEYFF